MADVAYKEDVFVRFYLEPEEPLEVKELSAALASLSRQYERAATESGFDTKDSNARLLIAHLAPGSIDVHLVPHLIQQNAPLLAVIIPPAAVLLKFVEQVEKLVSVFRGERKGSALSVSDCDDAINILGPTAQHGGRQTIVAVKGDAYFGTALVLDAAQAREVIEAASREKVRLGAPGHEPRQRVSMIWKRLDRDKAKTSGVRSPDLGLIEEIDPHAHAVMFTDELSYLKDEMIGDDDNPMRKVYFVDVEVSTISGRVTSYRIVGYHGSDDFDVEEPEDELPFV